MDDPESVAWFRENSGVLRVISPVQWHCARDPRRGVDLVGWRLKNISKNERRFRCMDARSFTSFFTVNCTDRSHFVKVWTLNTRTHRVLYGSVFRNGFCGNCTRHTSFCNYHMRLFWTHCKWHFHGNVQWGLMSARGKTTLNDYAFPNKLKLQCVAVCRSVSQCVVEGNNCAK